MKVSRPTRWTTAGGIAVLLALALGPGVAGAHEVAGSRFDAPLPLWLLFAGAGATVAITALWLTVSDRAAPSARRRALLTVPAGVAVPVRDGLRAGFLGLVLAALAVGVVGRQVPAENPATLFTWPVWFRGVAVLAVLLGNPWRTLSPWRTIYAGLVRLEGRALAVLGAYPSVLGAWPAVVGFVALVGVVENLTVVPRSPRLTTVVVAAYALAMVGGAVLYGPPWLGRADPLGVLYRLFGRVAPLRLADADGGGYDLVLRPPWVGCLDPVRGVPLVVFVVAMVYTVSFDGFANTRLFQALLFGARDALGTGAGTSLLVYLLGLGGFVVTFALVSWLVERLGAPESDEWLAAARRLAPTVLPIAAAYEVAHNYPYVLRNLGQLIYVSARPLVPLAGPVDPLWWLSVPAFWGSQVVLIVGGHVIAVVAAHFATVDRYRSRRRAARAQVPLTALMVGYTVLSLWIISQPVVSG